MNSPDAPHRGSTSANPPIVTNQKEKDVTYLPITPDNWFAVHDDDLANDPSLRPENGWAILKDSALLFVDGKFQWKWDYCIPVEYGNGNRNQKDPKFDIVDYEGLNKFFINQMKSDNKEEDMRTTSYTMHLLAEKVYDGVHVTYRIVTDIPSEKEHAAYKQSIETHRPAGPVLSILTGNYRFLLIDELLTKKGIPFRFMIIDNDQLKEMDPARVSKFHAQSNFVISSDGSTWFVKFPGVDKWGLETMGINNRYVKKLAKRMVEPIRLTEMGWFSPSDNLDIKVVDPDDPVEFHDGMNAISLDLALEIADEIPDRKRSRYVKARLKEEASNPLPVGEYAGHSDAMRWNTRVMTERYGLIKGDLIVVKGLAHDIVVHKENVKGEVWTDGWSSITMERHAPYHTAVWDTQSWINNRVMLPERKHQVDLNAMIEELKEDFKKGVVPEWLLLGEDAHDDTGLPAYERLSELQHANYIKWQMAGGNIASSQNHVYMATNGVVLRANRWLRKKPVSHYKKTWTLMSNAFLAGVVTRESLIEICGLDVPELDGLMWDGRYGLIMSGKRFLATYALHGGWDLDDSVKVILVKIWSDNSDLIKHLIEYGALDPDIEVPDNPNDAVVVALLVRSPNGPGEYSLEKLPENWRDMPWHKLNEETIPVVDLAKVPEPQGALMEKVSVQGIPTSITYTNEPLTREQSMTMLQAQMINPGIGAVCNALMTWSMVVGPSFPNEMLASLEDMVDTTQQTHDPVSLQAVADSVDALYEQLVNRVKADGLKVDKLMSYAHPIPPMFAKQLGRHMTNARFSRFNVHYASRIRELSDMIRFNSFEMRQDTDLVKRMVQFSLTPETEQWAKRFHEKTNLEFTYNTNVWKTPEDASPFMKMHFEVQRNKANKETVDRAVAELREFGGEMTYRRVLGLWIWILKQPLTRRNDGSVGGKSDRIVFAPGTDESVMDILIEALQWKELL